MSVSYLLLVVTCVFYGLTTAISSWDDFVLKLINSLSIIAIVVLDLITFEDGFIDYCSDYYWINLFFPVVAIFVGKWLTTEVIDADDWIGVFAILAVIGLIATVITTSCGI